MQRYDGRLNRWIRAIERWRKKGYSWRDIGKMLELARVRSTSAGTLGQLAWYAWHRNQLADYVNARQRRRFRGDTAAT